MANAMTRDQATEKVAELLKGIKVAMLTTCTDDGDLRSRPMATQEQEFDGTLWFFTPAHSPKVSEIERDHRVNISYSSPENNRYVSVSGVANLVHDKEKA